MISKEWRGATSLREADDFALGVMLEHGYREAIEARLELIDSLAFSQWQRAKRVSATRLKARIDILDDRYCHEDGKGLDFRGYTYGGDDTYSTPLPYRLDDSNNPPALTGGRIYLHDLGRVGGWGYGR